MTPNTNAEKRILDLTADTCPMTYVRTRLTLERLSPGDHLRVLLRGDEPIESVPRMAISQGHTVLSRGASETDPAVLEIVIERGAKA